MNLKQTIRKLDAFPRAEEHLLKKTQSGALVGNYFELSFVVSELCACGATVMPEYTFECRLMCFYINVIPEVLTDTTVQGSNFPFERQIVETALSALNYREDLSIIGLGIMATLFLHELTYYISTYTVHQMGVDLKRGETLPIHINMTFPSLPCDVLSVDAIDMSGKHEVDLDTNIWKLRLNKDSHIIGTEYLSDLVEKEHTAHKHDDPKDHHEDSDKKVHLQSFDKDAENMIKKVKQALADGEGCRVYGILDVQRVAGNFHISVHGLNIFVAQMIFEGSTHVNVSHIIHDLSFGPAYPGIHNPLDGTSRILQGASGTFKYYIKIVPTEYRYLSKEVLPTNQFSVTEYFSPIHEFDRTWPAVYFLYDLSPITVTIREERRSFLHFITRLCAVLGGTFALTGMLDRWTYRFIEAVTKPNARRTIR